MQEIPSCSNSICIYGAVRICVVTVRPAMRCTVGGAAQYGKLEPVAYSTPVMSLRMRFALGHARQKLVA